MTAVYEQADVRFLYPENWALDNREESGSPWAVSVHSPSGAFWSLTVHDGNLGLDELGTETLQAVEREYQESFFESIKAEDEIAGCSAVGYDINFFYFDLLVTAKLRVFRMGRFNCIVLYQAEDRDFEELNRVFQAITLSLFSDVESG
ncbi:MAG: hypothetical protein CMJ81_00780 [Planctomycetaceae bacterium]|nr:hypothetical protein [Planctomycetaceae bacterium]MBP60640.1 hypothetical protein [Planctomycetaceae bacterium]